MAHLLNYVVTYGSWHYHTRAKNSYQAKRNAANAYKNKTNTYQTVTELIKKMSAKAYV